MATAGDADGVQKLQKKLTQALKIGVDPKNNDLARSPRAKERSKKASELPPSSPALEGMPEATLDPAEYTARRATIATPEGKKDFDRRCLELLFSKFHKVLMEGCYGEVPVYSPAYSEIADKVMLSSPNDHDEVASGGDIIQTAIRMLTDYVTLVNGVGACQFPQSPSLCLPMVRRIQTIFHGDMACPGLMSIPHSGWVIPLNDAGQVVTLCAHCGWGKHRTVNCPRPAATREGFVTYAYRDFVMSNCKCTCKCTCGAQTGKVDPAPLYDEPRGHGNKRQRQNRNGGRGGQN